jgi:putative ABC transport system substrate-binding protein
MYAAPNSYIDMFRNMQVGRVGVICNPAKSGWYLRKAHQTAKQAGIELVVREVSTPREIMGQLSSLSGKVDALWMLPDTTAVTRETTEAYFRFGQENSVPVVSFADSYLGLGAAAAFEINRIELGRQADRLAAAILNGNEIGESVVFPQQTTIRLNHTVLKRLGSKYVEK